MGLRLKRKMFKIGQSHAVTLPPSWVSRHGAVAKEVTLIGNDVLLIVPLGFERQADDMVRQMEGSGDKASDSDREGGIR